MNHTLDTPQVVVFPPIVPLAATVIAILLQVELPLSWIAKWHDYARFPCAVLLLAIGTGLTVGGGRALRKNGTPVAPSLPTLVLVNDGVYRWSRNPMYVGGCLAMLGAAFLFALDWLLLVLPCSLLVLHFGIVKREERYLEWKFGDQYRGYASRVPRYLGRPAPAGRP